MTSLIGKHGSRLPVLKRPDLPLHELGGQKDPETMCLGLFPVNI